MLIVNIIYFNMSIFFFFLNQPYFLKYPLKFHFFTKNIQKVTGVSIYKQSFPDYIPAILQKIGEQK